MTEHRVPLGAMLFAVRDRGLGVLREPKNLARLDRLDRLDPAERPAQALFSEVRARGEWFRKCPALLEYNHLVQR
jgi:hypothetical protein